MKVALGFDHRGVRLRDAVLGAVTAAGHEALDLGVDTDAHRVDYPDTAKAVAGAILDGRAERGVLVCGSGAGVSIAASKIRGIRSAVCHDSYSAHQAVEHDDMNVLALGARVVGTNLAEDLVRTFLAARYTNEERHRRRLAKVRALEESGT